MKKKLKKITSVQDLIVVIVDSFPEYTPVVPKCNLPKNHPRENVEVIDFLCVPEGMIHDNWFADKLDHLLSRLGIYDNENGLEAWWEGCFPIWETPLSSVNPLKFRVTLHIDTEDNTARIFIESGKLVTHEDWNGNSRKMEVNHD